MPLIQIASVASISLLLLLGSFLAAKGRDRHRSFLWIALFFILLAINLTDGLLGLSGFYLQHPHLAGWEDPLVLLYGPVLYFFAASLTINQHRWTWRKTVHLAPALLFAIAILSFHLSVPAEQKIQVIKRAMNQQLPPAVLFTQLAIFVHFFSYALYARRLIAKNQTDLKSFYSAAEISWATTILNYLIAVFVLSLIASLVQYAGNADYFQLAIQIVVVAMTVIMFLLLMRALDQPILTAPVTATAPDNKLSAQQISLLVNKIKNFFEQDRGYENPDLTIKDLAEALAEPSREVSYVVNHHLAKNFYDLVNNYRVDAAKVLLADSAAPEPTVLQVMYEVGFNSKSSFNTQFKNKTGLTPSEFRKQSRSQDQN